MQRYPNISDHGIIGDLQTAALVSTDGTVDFFCCPRFLSPSAFASLLDADGGGYFRIFPAAGSHVSKQLYFPGTTMLITRFMTPSGVLACGASPRGLSDGSGDGGIWRRSSLRPGRRGVRGPPAGEPGEVCGRHQ